MHAARSRSLTPRVHYVDVSLGTIGCRCFETSRKIHGTPSRSRDRGLASQRLQIFGTPFGTFFLPRKARIPSDRGALRAVKGHADDKGRATLAKGFVGTKRVDIAVNLAADRFYECRTACTSFSRTIRYLSPALDGAEAVAPSPPKSPLYLPASDVWPWNW